MYDLRNTTLIEVLNNESEETNFKVIDIDDDEFTDSQSESLDTVSVQNLPTPTIVSLESNGILIIKFDKSLRVPEEYDQIPDTEVALRFMSARKETYLMTEGYREFDIRPALELQIQPGDGKEKSTLDFTWEIIEFTANEVKI